MKIAITHHQYKFKGGMEIYLFNLLRGFAEQHDQLTTYVYKKTKDSVVIGKIIKSNLFWLPRVFRKYWFRHATSRKERLNRYDLTISLMRSFYHDLLICGGTHLGFLRDSKKKMSWLDKLEVAYERKSYQTCSYVVAHSNLLKDELLNLYSVPIEKIVTLLPPVDTTQFNHQQRNQRQEMREKFGIHPQKNIILFPSTGHKRKGFYLLIEALSQLPENEFELVVAGDPPNTTNFPNVHYVGFVSEMSSLYSICDMTILPSLYEPFGLVVLESLQCGTPVIVSKFVGAKDLITDKEGIILDQLDPDSIAKAILQMAEQKLVVEPNFADRMGLTLDKHIQRLKEIAHEEKKTA